MCSFDIPITMWKYEMFVIPQFGANFQLKMIKTSENEPADASRMNSRVSKANESKKLEITLLGWNSWKKGS